MHKRDWSGKLNLLQHIFFKYKYIDAPTELVRTMDPVIATADTSVTFDFEEEPDDYSIQIWEDETTTTGSSSDIDLSAQGEVVYEVQAEWEQGEASYAFSLILE